MELDNRLPTGEWNGFYLENHQPRRGWMHLYMSFEDGNIKGEGTDYVGPWTASGSYDLDTGLCSWVKQYVGRHRVDYRRHIRMRVHCEPSTTEKKILDLVRSRSHSNQIFSLTPTCC